MVLRFGGKKTGGEHPSEIRDVESGRSRRWLGGFRRGLAKTRASLASTLGVVLSGISRIDPESIGDIEEALYMADIGPVTVEAVLEALRRGEGGGESPAVRVRAILLSLMEHPAQSPPVKGQGPPEGEPEVIFLVGVNGAGKTTTAGKLASRLASEGRKVMFAAADTFRAAAGEQVEVWAERNGCHIVRHQEGADPGAVVFDAIASARARGADVLLVDTAGRLHTKKNLMAELIKVCRVAGRQLPGAPHEILLVLDATSGQNALAQVREFGSALGVTGLVVTKLDGSAKGGVLIGAVHESGLPVRWIGVGEGIDDLIPFDAKAFTDALFEGEPT